MITNRERLNGNVHLTTDEGDFEKVSELLNVHVGQDIEVEIQNAEILVPEPNILEVQIAIEK